MKKEFISWEEFKNVREANKGDEEIEQRNAHSFKEAPFDDSKEVRTDKQNHPPNVEHGSDGDSIKISKANTITKPASRSYCQRLNTHFRKVRTDQMSRCINRLKISFRN